MKLLRLGLRKTLIVSIGEKGPFLNLKKSCIINGLNVVRIKKMTHKKYKDGERGPYF